MTSTSPTVAASAGELQEILQSPPPTSTPLITDSDVASGAYRRPSLSGAVELRNVTSVSPLSSPDEGPAKERGGRRRLTRSSTSGSITPLSTTTSNSAAGSRKNSDAASSPNDAGSTTFDAARPSLGGLCANSARLKPNETGGSGGVLSISTPAEMYRTPSQLSTTSAEDGYFTARPGSPALLELNESMAMLRTPSSSIRSRLRADRASLSSRSYVTAPHSTAEEEEEEENDDEACFVDDLTAAAADDDAKGKVDFLSRLPPELALCIVVCLEDHADLLTAGAVCRRWRSVAMDAWVWRRLFFAQKGWAIREDAPLVVRHQMERRAAAAERSKRAVKEVKSQQEEKKEVSSAYLERLAALKSWRETLHIPSFGGLGLGHAEAAGAQMSPLRSPTASSGRFGLFLSPVKGGMGTPAGKARRAREAEGYFGDQPLSRQASVASVESTRYEEEVEAEEEFAASLDWRRLFRDRWVLEGRWRGGAREVEGGDGRVRQGGEGGSGSSAGERTGRERRAFEPTKRFLRGHQDSVYCIRQDDGVGTGTAGKLVSGSRDRTIRVWDVETASCKHILKGHGASVLSLQYDDQILVSVSSDGQVFVWDFASILAIQRPAASTGAEDSTSSSGVQIDPESGALVHHKSDRVQCILRDHSSAVLDVVFDENWIVTGSKDATVRVWRRSDLASPTPTAWRKFSHTGPVNAVDLQGNQVVSASGEGSMYLWDLESGEKLHTFKGHTKGLACIVFRGNTLVSGSNDQTIRVWDTVSGECTHVLGEHHLLVRTVAYCPVRRLVVSGGYDRLIKLWSIDDVDARQEEVPAEMSAAQEQQHGEEDRPKVGKCLRDIRCHRARIFDVDFNTTRIVSASEDHLICLTNFGGMGIDASLFA